MKRIQLILTGVLTCFILFSCEKETIISVDLTSIAIPDSGGSQTVLLTTNKSWTASSNQSWCRISPSSGEEASSSRITISCDANTTYDARNCSITITCEEKTVVVNVSQATNNGLLIPQSEYNVTNEAQQLNIEVKANVKFIVEVDNGCKDWIKYNTTKGLTNSTVVLDIAKNEAYDGREGKVTIKQIDGNLSSTVIIKQGQKDGLFLTTSEYNLSNEKHTLTVEVKSNIEFEVKSEVEWIRYVETKGLNANQIILDVAKNDTYDDRVGNVTVKQKNGPLTGTIKVKQDENYGILVSQSEYNLTNEAQTIDVEVKYNVDYNVVIPNDCKEWIKVTKTKSLNTKCYTLSISKNESYNNRDGSITFKEKNGTHSATVSIKQAQTDYLEVDKKDYTVDINGGTITIDVQSNVQFCVTIADDAQSWLSVVGTKGLVQDKVQIAVAAGDDDTDRKGDIIISYGELKRIVSVHQYAYLNNVILFADERVKAKLVEAFDTNKDGELSIREARAVSSIAGVFGAIKTYKSFDEFQFFTGVKEIPNGMFSDWNLLNSIILPTSIQVIGESAFEQCVKLTDLVIPDGVTSIKNNTFMGCNSLSSVTIPKGVTIIGDRAFYKCSSLSSVEIPNGIQTIGVNAFCECHKISSITIFNKDAVIKDDAFSNVADEFYLTAPYFRTKNGKTIASGFSSLHFSFTEGSATIEDNEFKGITGLVSIVIPNSVRRIGNYAFEGCSCLATVEIPESVSIINGYTFHDCTSLQSVVIPESVTKIGNSAFSGCTSLQSVVIPESVTVIGNSAFSSCTSIVSVVIPESVTEIGDSAFSGCNSLALIKIPESVSIIRNYIFYCCTSLQSVVIPESVTKIGDYAFSGCTSLVSVVIPKSVTRIESNTFLGCTSLVSVVIPESVTKIGSYAFAYCKSLSSISIPKSVTSIGKYAFSHSGITSFVIPEGVTIIDECSFLDCISLSSVEIPSSVTGISSYAFYGSGLTSVVLPTSVTTIGYGAFTQCGKMKKITVMPSIPPTLTLYDLIENGGYLHDTFNHFDGTNDCPIYVPAASLEEYKLASGWRRYYASRLKPF